MQIYFRIMKKNIFLLMMTLVIMLLTTGFWLGLPLFGLLEILNRTVLPIFIQYVLVAIVIGCCYSLLWIPLHFSFAREYAVRKQKKTGPILLVTQSILVGFVSFMFGIFYFVASYMAS